MHHSPPLRDTESTAELVQLTAIRRLSRAARVRQALDLSELAMKLAVAGRSESSKARSDAELVERARSFDGSATTSGGA